MSLKLIFYLLIFIKILKCILLLNIVIFDLKKILVFKCGF